MESNAKVCDEPNSEDAIREAVVQHSARPYPTVEGAVIHNGETEEADRATCSGRAQQGCIRAIHKA